MARILARLSHLLRGDGEAPGAVAAVPAAGIAHADRCLHQLMAADLDRTLSFHGPAACRGRAAGHAEDAGASGPGRRIADANAWGPRPVVDSC